MAGAQVPFSRLFHDGKKMSFFFCPYVQFSFHALDISLSIHYWRLFFKKKAFLSVRLIWISSLGRILCFLSNVSHY